VWFPGILHEENLTCQEREREGEKESERSERKRQREREGKKAREREMKGSWGEEGLYAREGDRE